jgi:hypothetical protein
MIFNLIIFVLFLAIAYFHFTEGLFSATFSAIIAAIAAVVAVSYHELLTPFLMKMPEQADAMTIVGLFAITYVLLRVLFDKVVPGNVRFPFLMDKIGSVVMGIVVGLIGTGILALAAESLPFGISFGGFARQDIADRGNVVIPGDTAYNGRATDSAVYDEMQGEGLTDTAHQHSLWLHPADFVLGITSQLSNPGSALYNGQPFTVAHPDYLTELFAQRVGVPAGARHIVTAANQDSGVMVNAAYSLAKNPPAMDHEISAIRGGQDLPTVPSPDSTTALVVLPVDFSASPATMDTDQYIRFSPASARLKTGANDYYPVGTLVGGTLLMKNRVDDPLMIATGKGNQTVNFVYVVPTDDLDLRIDGKERKLSFKDNSYFEFKRYARQDLSGMELSTDHPKTTVESATDVQDTGVLGGIIRKKAAAEEAMKELGKYMLPIAPGKPGKNRGDNAVNRANSEMQNNKNNSEDLLPTLPNHAMGL